MPLISKDEPFRTSIVNIGYMVLKHLDEVGAERLSLTEITSVLKRKRGDELHAVRKLLTQTHKDREESMSRTLSAFHERKPIPEKSISGTIPPCSHLFWGGLRDAQCNFPLIGNPGAKISIERKVSTPCNGRIDCSLCNAGLTRTVVLGSRPLGSGSETATFCGTCAHAALKSLFIYHR
ncbi:MAG: hypothetical protein ACI9QL_003074 [Candidatus Omnitrophota bacterium]|jgi:hypothetical protein